LSEVDVRLARIESRLNAVRTDLNAVRDATATIAAENPDLPRVRAEIELLLDRLIRTFDRAEAIADSLQSAAAGFRTAADIVGSTQGRSRSDRRARNAADKVDRAAESLNGLRARVDELEIDQGSPADSQIHYSSS